MPRLHERERIRAVLETDRTWSVYALGDLSPELFPRCEWYAETTDPPALILLYRGFDTPVLFALGAAGRARPLLDEVPADPAVYLSVRPDVLALIKERYTVDDEMPMWRMVLDDSRPQLAIGGPRPAPLHGTAGVAALQRLYADGDETGEAPGFFSESMVGDGAYYGVFEGEELLAAAGTHLVSLEESVAAVGNVYTRRDSRGRGLAAQAMAAVMGRLREQGIRTIVLNVAQSNTPAVRLYERLGFARHCEFYEGVAARE